MSYCVPVCLVLGAMMPVFSIYCVNSLNSGSVVHAEEVNFSGVTGDHFIVGVISDYIKSSFLQTVEMEPHCRKPKVSENGGLWDGRRQL